MERCPKNEPTAKNLVCKRLFAFLRKTGKTCSGGGGGWHPPALAIGGLKFLCVLKGLGWYLSSIGPSQDASCSWVSAKKISEREVGFYR